MYDVERTMNEMLEPTLLPPVTSLMRREAAPPTPPAVPPVALEYQPPQPPAGRRGDMGWGLLISFFLAMGVGWFIFGALMMAGYRDDYAGPVAVGAGFITMGAGTAAALTWTRRRQQNQHSPR